MVADRQPDEPVPPPLVSLLIPVFNRVELTRACLDSVLACADPAIPCEILVIDDCSTDGTASYLASLGDAVRVVRNATRQGFGANMNHAASLARGDYLCLLNNDTQVSARWLAPMLAAARRDARIGVVGNRHLTPGGRTINHAGMVFDRERWPVHLYPGKPADFPPARISREFQILTAACWLVPRSLFLELGGFDPAYRNGYEDVDFCLRVREHGRTVYYAGDSVIWHHGQASPGRTDNETANAAYFRQKWYDRIVPDLDDYLTRDGQIAAPAAVVPASPVPVPAGGSADLHLAVPLRDGNSFTWVVADLALACEAAGMTVSLPPGPLHASLPAPAQARLRRMMERAPSARAQVRWTHYWGPYWEQVLAGRIKAEIFVTNYRTGPRRIEELDQWMRHVALNPNRKLPVSRYTLDALTDVGVPAERCRLLPHGHSPELLESDAEDDRFRRHGFVLLAFTNGHDPYRHGTDLLLKAYRRAFAGRDDVVLVLKDYGAAAAGPLAGWIGGDTTGPRIVHLTQFLDKGALMALYRGADALVAPFRGEGFGMKILDACALGLPVLAPAYGGPLDFLAPDGFVPLRFREVPVGECLDRSEGIVPACARWAEVDIEDMAAQLRGLVADPGPARRRAAAARPRVLREFSWARAAERLGAALEAFEQERERAVAPRRLAGPAAHRISVVIPTYNRPDRLARCLQSFERQTLPRQDWEILLVDDASGYDVDGLVAPFRERLPLQLLRNPRNTGPGLARNLAVPRADGELLLFVGDDIFPDRALLAQHLAAHRRNPGDEVAVLGRIEWDPSLEITPLMAYITGEGGQQFAFEGLAPHSFVSPGLFYTSNVSVKRRFLVEEEELFSDKLTAYGFEDIELGQRLAVRGMRLFYAPLAVATHLHPMTDDEVYGRQYRVGRSLVVYGLMHPQYLATEHRSVLGWLDALQHDLLADPGFAAAAGPLAETGRAAADLLAGMADSAAALASLGPAGLRRPAPVTRLLGAATAQWAGLGNRLYRYRLDLALHDGLADAWFGVAPGAPNAARDFLRYHLCTAIWALLGRGPAPAPTQQPASSRTLELARRLRRGRLIEACWRRALKQQLVRPILEAGKQALLRLP